MTSTVALFYVSDYNICENLRILRFQQCNLGWRTQRQLAANRLDAQGVILKF